MSELEQHYADAIAEWEPTGAELVRQIDDGHGTLERIVKSHGSYYLYRYFEFKIGGPVNVSVDHNGVDAETIIQHLAERL